MMKGIDLPNPGPGRFWHGAHRPASEKTPLVLELRESSVSGSAAKVSFSKLIAKQSTIADEKMIRQAAEDILIRAGKVDDFVGILAEGS